MRFEQYYHIRMFIHAELYETVIDITHYKVLANYISKSNVTSPSNKELVKQSSIHTHSSGDTFNKPCHWSGCLPRLIAYGRGTSCVTNNTFWWQVYIIKVKRNVANHDALNNYIHATDHAGSICPCRQLRMFSMTGTQYLQNIIYLYSRHKSSTWKAYALEM